MVFMVTEQKLIEELHECRTRIHALESLTRALISVLAREGVVLPEEIEEERKSHLETHEE